MLYYEKRKKGACFVNDIVISAENISKKIVRRKAGSSFFKPEYEEKFILRDIYFSASKGECIAVIGENGGGKSSLLNILSGADSEFDGTLSINSKPISINALIKKLKPKVNGRKNLKGLFSALGIKNKDIPPLLTLAEDFCDLGDSLDENVSTFSLGMKARLVFSAVAFAEPLLVFIDDMQSLFDAVFIKKAIDKITELKLSGTTFIISDSTLSLPYSLSARTVVLREKTIISDGTPEKEVTAFLEKAFAEKDRKLTRFYETRTAAESERSRWGNKNIEILGVDLFSGSGKKCSDFDPEGRMVIRIEYKINKPVSEIGFSVGIFGTDGICRYFTDTYIDGVLVDIKQRGRISLIIERSGFMESSYRIDVAAHDKSGMPYDYVLDIARFKTSSPINDRGMFRPLHRWEND